MNLEGLVNLQLSSKSVGPIQLISSNIEYTLRCDMKRSLLAKDLSRSCEFIVHSQPQKAKVVPTPVNFTITPDTLQNSREPLTGELVVENSDVPIKSIELQLFEVNVVMVLHDDHLITENFPLKLCRV
ncbi:hypothetical protein F7725_006543 [Dissostichus mawsoni]|uniref:Uncharacterized protein n=1 Tax=Dissostichus mawsoni TaxID=36200 RepID=A0A7J5XUV9_DISMA|nr:hypothetical protein F7725_006543 [Dissostichus mawsoni]